MIVTYTPGDGPAQTFVFTPGAVRASRAEMIERRWAGGNDPEAGPSTYKRWLLCLEQGEAKAIRVLLWHILSILHPGLKFEDVDPGIDEVKITPSGDEIDRQIDMIRRSKLPPHRIDRAIEYLESQRGGGEDEGKVT